MTARESRRESLLLVRGDTPTPTHPILAMTFSLLRMPMFGFFGLGFLFFAAVVAVAVWLAVRSGEKGSTKLGGFAGCAIAVALVVSAGMGALGCTAIALLNTPNEIVQRGPVKRFQFRWGEDHREHHATETEEAEAPEQDPEHAVQLRFEIEGVEADEVARWIREHTDSDIPYAISTTTTIDGEERLVHLDVSLPISEDEVRRMREAFHRDFPDLRLPVSIDVELRTDREDE